MKCPQCRSENRPQAKFCEEVATPLSRICSNSSTPLSPTAKFCPECAHPIAAGGAEPRFAPQTPSKHLAEKILTSKSALEGERKQVTVLFADLKGSMELLADRDPEEARKLLKKLAAEVITEQSERSPMARKVHASFTKFQALVGPWDHVAEGAYHQLIAV